MTPARVFITRAIAPSALERIAAVCTVDLWEGEMPPPYSIICNRVSGVDGLLSLITDRIDGGVYDAAGSSLKVVSNMAVGYNNVDVVAAQARGIAVGNTPGVLTDATADLAMALLLASARRIVEGVEYVRAGEWRTWHPNLLVGRDLSGATLGIIGFGRIGRAVARRAQGFGMRVLAYSPSLSEEDAQNAGVTCADIDTILRESDFVSLHCPLIPETRHLIDGDALSRMKSSAILINTSRGPVVDQTALYEALQDGRIGGAALDVTDPEPMPDDDPLLLLPNAIVIPHLGSATAQTREKMALIAADNLIAGVTGQPLPHAVTP